MAADPKPCADLRFSVDGTATIGGEPVAELVARMEARGYVRRPGRLQDLASVGGGLGVPGDSDPLVVGAPDDAPAAETEMERGDSLLGWAHLPQESGNG
jgi:hypothetical protein